MSQPARGLPKSPADNTQVLAALSF